MASLGWSTLTGAICVSIVWLYGRSIGQVSEPAGVEPPSEPVQGARALKTLGRSIWANPGRCWIRYELTHAGAGPLILKADQLRVHYIGTLSNSACPAHQVPRRVHASLGPENGFEAVSVLLEASSEKDRCSERLWVGIATAPETIPQRPQSLGEALTVEPGSSLWVVLGSEHQHFLYGPHDPLLGRRQVLIEWDGFQLKDSVELPSYDSSQDAVAYRLEPPASRLDPRRCVSRPGSLYLAADLPGYQYFRFDDVQVRYGSAWILRFKYLTAPGSEARGRVRVVEYQDAPRCWRRLGGAFDVELPPSPRWTEFTQPFRVSAQATTLALDFRMTGSDVGELWVDDVELTPQEASVEDP
jgi:hypothetical protein